MNRNQYIGIYIIVLSLVIIIEYIERNYNIELPKSELKKYEPFTIILLAGILAPVVEEVMFRYPLVKGKYTYIALGISSIFIYFMSNTIFITISFLILNILTFVKYYFCRIRKLPYYLLIIYSSLFILVHIENYNLQELFKQPFVTLLSLFSAQIILSIALVYIRLKAKRFYPVVLFHAMYNFSIIILSLIDI